MMERFLPMILVLTLCTGMARASDDLVEQSHVVVPDGVFGGMRKVDSQTLILPDASAVMRREQQRTAAREARDRAAQRAEAARLSPATTTQAAASTPAAVADPEAILVEESVQSVAAVEEPSAAVAEPAPATPEPEPEPSPAEESTSEQE
jgi:hypothetical protein